MTETVSTPSIPGFELLEEVRGQSFRRDFRARAVDSGQIARLTVFLREVSTRPEFRRAFKTDRAVLGLLQHVSIRPVSGSGESDGLLYYWTPWSDAVSLQERIKSGLQLSVEDIIEIGWQVCSALQHAHNLGLPHGGLNSETVMLTDTLQVEVTDFGVARWMKALQTSGAEGREAALITVSALASREDVGNDLWCLAMLLTELQVHPDIVRPESDQAPDAERERNRMEEALQRLLARALSSEDSGLRLTSAREFQGRLGEILIGGDVDAMPLVDERNGGWTSRRSIVQELFEPEAPGSSSSSSHGTAAGSAGSLPILPVLAVVAMVILLILLAGWLF